LSYYSPQVLATSLPHAAIAVHEFLFRFHPQSEDGFMNTEQELDLAADMIKHDAPSQGIDFEDPANAYTVWTPFPNRMQFCGNRRTLDEACSLAGDHIRPEEPLRCEGTAEYPWHPEISTGVDGFRRRVS
jgi:hypothetical protein